MEILTTENKYFRNICYKLWLSVALMLLMKQNGQPVTEVNSFINEIVTMATNPIAVT